MKKIDEIFTKVDEAVGDHMWWDDYETSEGTEVTIQIEEDYAEDLEEILDEFDIDYDYTDSTGCDVEGYTYTFVIKE